MNRVLVVDDEPQILRALVTNLRARGYDVDAAGTGEIALQLAARHRPDLVVLDLGLPDITGLDVIGGLRGWTDVPIVILSARETERDKIAALDAGADDYVTKPFGMGELLARLRVALRRVAPTTDAAPQIVTPDFTVDFVTKRVQRDGEEVKLTPTEWHMVEVLVRNAGKLVDAAPAAAGGVGSRVRHRDELPAACTWRTSARSSNPSRRDRATSSPRPAWATASRPAASPQLARQVDEQE